MKPKVEHQLDTASRGIDVPTDTSKLTETMLQGAKHSANVSQAAAANPSFPKSGGSIESKIPAGTEVEDKASTNATTAAPNANAVNQTSYETSKNKTASATIADKEKANEVTGVKTTATTTVGMKKTISATAEAKATAKKTPEINVDKAVHIGGALLVQIQDDIIFYDFKTITSTLCPQDSPRMEEEFTLKCLKDIKSETCYRKHIHRVKEYYSSLY